MTREPRPFPRCKATLWYELLTDVALIEQRTGFGMAKAWSHIQRDEYEAARAHVDDLLAELSDGVTA